MITTTGEYEKEWKTTRKRGSAPQVRDNVLQTSETWRSTVIVHRTGRNFDWEIAADRRKVYRDE